MKKKLFLVIAIVAVLACLFAISVSAAAPNYDGEKVTLADGTVCPLYDLDGNPLVWIVTSTAEDGTRTYAHVSAAFFDTANPPSTRVDFISTGGSAYEFNNLTVTLDGVEYAKSAVVVLNMRDAKITSVDKGREGNAATFPYRAMENCTNLEYLYLHTGTTSIGQTSFNSCNNLKYVNFDELTELKDIGQQAFNNCSKLYEGKVLDFSNTKLVSTATNSLRTIAATEAIFPATFTSFGQETFRECPNITKITFLGELESAGTSYSFYNCKNLETIVCPGKGFGVVTNIGQQAFQNCTKLKQVDGLIENGVVTVPNGVKTIEGSAFNSCPLITSVILPDSVTLIQGNAFYGCTALESINIPAAVTALWGSAFRGCTALKTVDIPDDSLLYDIGADTFRDCTSLERINLVDGIYKMGNDCFHNAGLTYVKLPNGIATHESRFVGYNTFQDCKNLTTIDFSNCPMTTFPVAFALNCDGLRYLSLPEGVKSFSTNCFDGCDNLEAVYLPNSVEILNFGGWNNGAFANNPKMYFVQNPMTPVENYADFKMPAKPEVYFMPTSLRSEQDPSTQGISQSSGPLINCKNLNKYLVFPEGFTNFYTNDNWFKFSGTKENPINIVCLGDMTDVVYNSAAFERSSYISYYFMNPADQDISDVNFTSTNTAKTPAGAYAVFCHSNCYYPINGKTLTEDGRVDITAETALTTTHIRNPRLDTTINPTCTEKGSNDTYCFCDPEKENKLSTVEIPALGHDKDKELSYNVWVWENDNYFDNAKYKHVCQVCSVEYLSEEYIENSYLFVKEGFATFANKDGETIKSYDFQYSIKVNTDAMDNYTVATGKVIKYGTVAGVGDSLTNPISYENGTLSVGESAAVSDMTGTDYVKLLIKVTNIPVLDEGVKITCNAYAIVDDKLRYVGETTVTENAQYSVIK